MTLSVSRRRAIRLACAAIVITNTVIFLTLALSGTISNAPATIVFVDFWGRLTVYSFWFLAFAFYERMFADRPAIRTAILVLLALNVPLFLGTAYAGLLPEDPVSAVMIDFWGRLTVYSVWFVAYLAYNQYVAEPGGRNAETV